VAPTIDLRTSSPQLKIERTRVVDLVADATSAQGSLTVDIDSASVPLLDAEEMTASGTIHLSQSAVGAGPLAEQLLGSVLEVRKLLKPGSEEKTVRTSIEIKDLATDCNDPDR